MKILCALRVYQYSFSSEGIPSGEIPHTTMIRDCLKILVMLLICSVATSQQRFSIGVHSSITHSGSRFEPTLSTPFASHSFNNIVGYNLDARWSFPEDNFILGISLEYLSHSESYESYRTNINEGFTIYPAEISGYFTVPLNSEKVLWYVGGGGGIYFGTRTLTIANVEATTTENNPQFGIHVSSGVEYAFTDFFSLRSEIKFRDVQLESASAYDLAPAPPDFSARTYRSELHIDGIFLGGGVVVKF